ncbi:MAG: hypothetical protein WBE89_08620 [Methyloceanibacter sp.]
MRNFFDLRATSFWSEVLARTHPLVILLYCLSYADQWYANLFGFLEKRQPLTGSTARQPQHPRRIILPDQWTVHVIVKWIAHAQH